jgi:hypothetical protein
VKGEGMFESTDSGAGFQPFRENDFQANHQINRLWSYSPGALLKSAPSSDGKTTLFAMTGENLFRFQPNGDRLDLPLRESVQAIGEIDLNAWRGAVISLCVAGLGAIGVATSAILRWRRIRARRKRV